MNIANVTARFAAYTGLSGDGLLSQSALIESALDYINSLCAVENPDCRQTKRLENLSAVYAYRLYEMRGGSDVTSFTAGDVKITSSAGGKGGAEALWEEQKKLCSDILRSENFLFGRM